MDGNWGKFVAYLLGGCVVLIGGGFGLGWLVFG
jgi:hypothetical protein